MAARLIALAAALAAAGCGDAGYTICPRPATDDPLPYTQGKVTNGVYSSADPDGELLHYPGGAYYQITHGLGVVPQWWQCELSFQRDGLASGSLSPAAGNECEIKAMDDKTITVLNGTCVEFYLLFKASGTAP